MTEEVLPAVPERIEPVAPGLAGPARTGAVTSGPFIIEGLRARVEGKRRSAGGRVTFPGVGAATVSGDEEAGAANLTLFPGVARRDFVGRSGTGVETAIVAPTLPLVVFQLEGSARVQCTLTVDVELEPDGDGSAAVERSPAGVALHGDTRVLAFALRPDPTAIEVTERDGSVRVSITTPPERHTTLVLAGGDPSTVRAALGAARHASAHAIRAAAGPSHGGLRLETGVQEIDDGVAWARARLLRKAAEGGPSALPVGLAALAVGDRESAIAALDSATPGGTTAEALLAARFAAVFGEVRRAGAVARAWIDGEVPADADGLASLAATSLADALLHAVPPATTAELRRLAARAEDGSGRGRETIGSPTGGRVLPSVGRPRSAPTRATWLAGLLAGDPCPEHASAGAADPGNAAALARASCALFPHAPAEGWAAWRGLLARGLREGPMGPATWDDPGRAGDSVTAELLLTTAHGLLGLAPDAPAGRLRLAPRLPAHITAFRATGLVVGDAFVGVSFRREGERVFYALEPEGGPVPPVVVFEPTVTGSVRGVLVDGEPVELSIRRGEGISVVPVQLPIDGPRTIEILG